MRGWLLVATIPTLSFILPLLLYICPSFFQPLFFGHFIRDYDDFNLLKGVVSYGRNFYLNGEAGRLGCWHILPKTLSEEAKQNRLSNEVIEKLMAEPNYTIIVYLHGSTHSRQWTNRVDTYNVLSAMDLHILCLDYRGFGESDGYPSEAGIIADSIFLFNYTKNLAGKNYIFIWGHSMGSGIAIAVAMELSMKNMPPAGLILEAPFNNLIDLITQSPYSAAWRWTPWFNVFLKQSISRSGLQFNSDKNIKLITCPILIMHAVDDEIIAISLAKKLRDAALSANRDVTFISFAAERGLLHKNINKASELPLILKVFFHKMNE
uniref:2-arachidonoylglycerol hydrolase ABHD12 n=2 Tax=Onchocerca TaxID=6281 RepID=A0A8R1TXI2_ONCVO